MPLFSVIVPAHNSAAFIRKCLHSIKYQTFTDYELIVVCDACTDDTAKIALNYADKTLIRDYHRDGLSRNAGIDAAEGKYVIFIDSDDWWLHEYVFQMFANILVQGDWDMLEYGVIRKGSGYHDARIGRIKEMTTGHVWSREYIGDTRFDDGQFSSDTRFLKELMKRKPKVVWLDMPMYYYNAGRIGSLCDLHKKGMIK